MKMTKTSGIAKGGLVAASYVVLGLALAPISFGPAQLRVSEALTLLPVIFPSSVWGLTLGCAITNLVGASTGANFLGIADVFIGSCATLVAALMTARLRNIRWKGLPLAASLPPVLVNAVVIGAEWSYVTTGSIAPLAVLPFAGLIAAGQAVSCCVMGVLLVHYMEKSGVSKLL